MNKIIKSVYGSDKEILESINTLYLNDVGFCLDPTYSKGNFYKEFPNPKYKSDKVPQFDDVVLSDCTKLWLLDKSINHICFDPPFLFRTSKTKNNDVSCKRFSYFESRAELLEMYKKSLFEFNRVMNMGGILAFKCQDASEWGKNYFTHIDVFNLAESNGFKAMDLFIITVNNRIYHGELKQRMARKFHSYWYVFKKTS